MPLMRLELTPPARVLLETLLSAPPLAATLTASTLPAPPAARGLGLVKPSSVSSADFALNVVDFAASGLANPAVARAIASATSSAASASAVPAATAAAAVAAAAAAAAAFGDPPVPSPLPSPLSLLSAAAAAGSAVADASLLTPVAAANTLPPRSSLDIGPLDEAGVSFGAASPPLAAAASELPASEAV